VRQHLEQVELARELGFASVWTSALPGPPVPLFPECRVGSGRLGGAVVTRRPRGADRPHLLNVLYATSRFCIAQPKRRTTLIDRARSVGSCPTNDVAAIGRSPVRCACARVADRGEEVDEPAARLGPPLSSSRTAGRVTFSEAVERSRTRSRSEAQAASSRSSARASSIAAARPPRSGTTPDRCKRRPPARRTATPPRRAARGRPRPRRTTGAPLVSVNAGVPRRGRLHQRDRHDVAPRAPI
jgi:hypothetical protein